MQYAISEISREVCTSDTMDGQQVFVTGADGEQMVLSGPEAAALLAQAGISLGDQEQVMMGDGGEFLESL